MNGWVMTDASAVDQSLPLEKSYPKLYSSLLPSQFISLRSLCSCSMSVCFKEKKKNGFHIAEGKTHVVFSLINPVVIK